MMGSPYANAPQVWLFNDQDREKYSGMWWSCPTRLVTDGSWAKVWREEETRRGGGTISSVLPVLCLHTWPGKTQGADNSGEDAASIWTAWTHLSYRRIARLSGVNTETVGKVFRRLAGLEWLQQRRVPPPAHYGGPLRKEYRLRRSLYSDGDGKPFIQVFGNLFYGGAWYMLPTPASRQLYVTIACLDPVLNDEAMRRHLSADNHPDTETAITEIRMRKPLSLSALVQASGMQRSTVEAALAVLTTPLYDVGKGKANIPLVGYGPADRTGMKWYAPDRRAPLWFWHAEVLNDRNRVEQERRVRWPIIAARQDALRIRRTTKELHDVASRRSRAAKKGWERRRNGKDGLW
jgi:hypothetical protein